MQSMNYNRVLWTLSFAQFLVMQIWFALWKLRKLPESYRMAGGKQ